MTSPTHTQWLRAKVRRRCLFGQCRRRCMFMPKWGTLASLCEEHNALWLIELTNWRSWG